MERTSMIRQLRAAALAAALAPLVAACSSLVDNETIGSAPTETSASNANVNFIRYAAIGTSLGAGIQSGGILDSTQQDAYPYQLALAMGLTPGVDWFYPALSYPGCPAPYSNALTQTRLGNTNVTLHPCYLRVPSSVEGNVNNTSIPGIRAVHVLDISNHTYPTDATPNQLSQFFTGNVNPISMVSRQHATMVTLEVGANDALQAALNGSSALLTPLATFTAQMTEIADSLDALGVPVAVGNVPDVTLSPHMTYGYWFYCLKNGCGAPLNIPATAPFNGANFVVMANCNHGALAPGTGKGDSSMVAFPTTAGMAQALTGGAGILLDCAGDSVRINVGAGFVVPTQFPGYILSPAEYGAIRTAISQFNAAIATLAARPNWTLVDINAALGVEAAAGHIPPFPNMAYVSGGGNPDFLFGYPFPAPTASIFSQDGFHPTRAGQRLLAQAFATAINAKWGTTLTIP
jgi:lysophospholipase L1-like esterase